MSRTQFDQENQKQDVYTPLGHGRIVYTLPDGTIVVQFDHGGGHIFRVDEIFRPKVKRSVASRTRYEQPETLNG